VIFLRGDRVCFFKPGLPTNDSIPLLLLFGWRGGPNTVVSRPENLGKVNSGQL
jgi:hypothetical protein